MSRRSWCVSLPFVLALPLFVSADEGPAPVDPPPAAAPAADGNAAALRDENAQLKRRIAELEAEVANLRQRLGEEQTQREQLATQARRLQTEHEDLSAENKRLEELAGMTAKGEKVESAAALIRSRYVPEDNQTVVTTAPERLEHDAGVFEIAHVLFYEYRYDGQSMSQRPQTVTGTIRAIANQRKKYKDVQQLTFTLDGETLAVPVTVYEITNVEAPAASRAKQKRFDELVRFELDDAALRRIAQARTGSIQIGPTRLGIPAEVLATAKAVRARIEMGQ